MEYLKKNNGILKKKVWNIIKKSMEYYKKKYGIL